MCRKWTDEKTLAFQALIKSESDENWPTEFNELRNKFTSNKNREIQTLKERHVKEIKRLREESNQIITGLHDEIKRIKAETHESLQSNLIKERWIENTPSIYYRPLCVIWSYI